MMEFKINENVLKATLSYLQTKPFNEVAALVQALGNLVVIPAVVEPKKEKNGG